MKYSEFTITFTGGTAPNDIIPQSPSIEMAAPFASFNGPRDFPVESNPLIFPSPKFPTRVALLKSPKAAGALAIPHGEFSTPFDAKRETNVPSGLKMLIYPFPPPD